MTQETPAATVLVTGATGQVGVFVIPRLLARARPVLALSRSAAVVSIEHGSEVLAGSVRWLRSGALWDREAGGEQAQLRKLLGDVGVLLSCGPVALAAQWAPRCPRLRRVVCISTSSVHTKRDSPDAEERALIARICLAENELKNHCARNNIALALLRPTLIYGCGLDQNISRIASLIRCFHFFPVAGPAAGLRQPVHADDLAHLVVKLAGSEKAVSLESAVGGGSVLTYHEMVSRIFSGLGMAPRILRIPPRLLALLVWCVAWLPAMRGLNTGFALRQNSDQIFDDSYLRELTGFKPRPFEPSASDFEVPSGVRRT